MNYSRTPRVIMAFVFALLVLGCLGDLGRVRAEGEAPVPLLEVGRPVTWWFVFKLNTKAFPGCGGGAERTCSFGGDVQDYDFGQQFVFASDLNTQSRTLQPGGAACVGDTTKDPLGATFDQVYKGSFFYVIWNDQFYDDPEIDGCTKSCSAPWGHSKGMLAWNEAGNGLVLQVSTPSWPAAGSKKFPRKSDGNTLGCVEDDDVKVSQHFFSLKLTKDDVVKVLQGLNNASVVTDPQNPQIVKNGGPSDVQRLVDSLGKKSQAKSFTKEMLSTGVLLISKPSGLRVPPWQMVSAVLGSVPLRTATWWANPKIYSTVATSHVDCWTNGLGTPGPVEIAIKGAWQGTEFGLKGGAGSDFNHAKIGVGTSGAKHYAIFGDLNQQGSLSGKCASSQNGRGGLFYVIDDQPLSDSIGKLIGSGLSRATAPTNDTAQ